MASSLASVCRQGGAYTAMHSRAVAQNFEDAQRQSVQVHNTYRSASSGHHDPSRGVLLHRGLSSRCSPSLVRKGVAIAFQHSCRSAGLDSLSSISSDLPRCSTTPNRNLRLKIRASADDSGLSSRHSDKRRRKAGSEWLDGQQLSPIRDRSQRTIRGGNWILRRGPKSKAVWNGEAVTDNSAPSNSSDVGQTGKASQQSTTEGRDVLDGGADLVEYRWTGPAERSLLDIARTGGQWNPLQIDSTTVETSNVSTQKDAVVGTPVPEADSSKSAKEASESNNWKILVGLFFAFCLLTSADKAAMSVAPMSMAKQFGWLESDKGLIGSSFFFGFMFSQIPSSILCKRIGRRRIMTGVALWIGACQLLIPIMASTSLTGLLAVRAALGFGEGVVVPILASMLADYVPAEKRSSSLALVFSGGPVGTVLSLFLCPKILHSCGWQPLFYGLGAVSLAWGAAWAAAAPRFETLPLPKLRWNPFRKTRKTTVTQPPVPEASSGSSPSKLYKDSPLLMETGIKLTTLPALGPDGKRRPAAPAATARVDPGLILNGTNMALAADVSDEVIFSPDDPYWKLAPDARRKLRQRRIAIRGRFAQSPRAAPAAVESPRKRNALSGMALPLPHSAQQSLAGERSPGVLSPVPAEATVAAARRRAGVPLLRPLRSTGTICSSSAVGDALVAEPPAAAPLRNAFSGAAAGAPAESERIPWGRFFASRSFWAIAGAHFCSNWGWNSFMAWLPTYFTQKLGLDLAASSTITLIPWTMAFLAGNTSGMLADWMSGTGMHKTKVRKIIQSIAFLGPAVGLALLTRISTASEAVVLFCGVLALGSFSAGGFCSNHSDISPKHAGTLYALTNTAGCLGGSASVALTGILLDKTGNWNYVWLGASLMYVIGTLWYVSLGSTERDFE